MFSPILWPREQVRHTTDDKVELWGKREIEIVSTLGTWKLPDNISWSEDPFGSRIWSVHFQSLGWAYSAEAAFKQGQFDEFPNFIKELVLDFATHNSDAQHPTHELTYHSGANAFRLANIAYWYENYLKEGNPYGITFSRTELAALSNSLEIQRDEALLQLAQEERWEANNHRFFHSMALSSYASIFGNVSTHNPLHEKDAKKYLNQGLEILQDIISDIIFTEEGVTAEQSFTYHRLALGLLIETMDSVIDAGYSLDIDFNRLITRMYEFDLISLRPGDDRHDRYSTEVGDTNYHTLSGASYLNILDEQLTITSPIIEWFRSDGTSGERPADLNYYDDAGYVFIRPEYEWENARDMRVFFDVSPAVHSHGHYDNTNVLLSLYGENILIDSGGPYSYDNINPFGYDWTYQDSLREYYFITSQAHNIVVVDGHSSDSNTHVNVVYDDVLHSHISAEREFSFVAARPGPAYQPGVSHTAYQRAMRASYDDILLTRDVIVLKNAGITLNLDTIENAGRNAHDYSLNWHLNPDAIGVDAASYSDFEINGVFVDAAFSSSHHVDYEYFYGYEGRDSLQGWITRDIYTMEAAPVINMEIQGVKGDAWFASAFSASKDASVELFLFVNALEHGGYDVYTEYDGTYNVIHLNSAGSTTVTEYEQGGEGAPQTISHATKRHDRLIGSNGDEWLVGSSGNDVVHGRAGDDVIFAGAGRDRLIAGDGDDILYSETGNDVIFALTGNNTIHDGVGHDRVRAGNGNDIVFNGTGNDLLVLGGGDDTVVAADGLDRLHGGEGIDTLIVSTEIYKVSVDMRDGYAIVTGDRFDDVDIGRNFLFGFEQIGVEGSEDNIFLDTDDVDTQFRDGIGNDIYYLGAGTDHIYAGRGIDTAYVQGNSADFLINTTDNHTSLLDRNVEDGDLGRDYLYDVELLVFDDITLMI